MFVKKNVNLSLKTAKQIHSKVWSGIRFIIDIINVKANDKYSPRIDITLTANEKNIANLFNNIFTSIAQKLGKKPPSLICHCVSRFQRE